MNEADAFREWFEYNREARHRYLEAFSSLPREELARDRGASFPTILGIQAHSLRAIHFWLMRSTPGGVPPLRTQLDDPPTLPQLTELEHEVDERVEELLRTLTPEEVDRVYVVPKGRVFESDTPLSVRATRNHLIEEELQHRGELNALLWQIDIDPPIFDWIDWEKLRRPTSP